MKEKNFVTMAQYAKAKGLSRASVLQAVREGRIRSNGKKGRECRVLLDSPSPVRKDTAKNNAAASAGEDDSSDAPASEYQKYLELKCKKLKADTRLAELQEETRIREIREQAIAEFVDSMAITLADLRKRIETLPNSAAFSAILMETMDAIKASLPL